MKIFAIDLNGSQIQKYGIDFAKSNSPNVLNTSRLKHKEQLDYHKFESIEMNKNKKYGKTIIRVNKIRPIIVLYLCLRIFDLVLI